MDKKFDIFLDEKLVFASPDKSQDLDVFGEIRKRLHHRLLVFLRMSLKMNALCVITNYGSWCHVVCDGYHDGMGTKTEGQRKPCRRNNLDAVYVVGDHGSGHESLI